MASLPQNNLLDTPASNGGASNGNAVLLRLDEDNWPRFLIIRSLSEKPILKLSIFIISKAIQGNIGEAKNVTPLKKAGLLLIEVDKKHHAENLLKTELLHDIPVEITPHRTLNSVKGVIFCDYLEHEDDNEILENLKETNQKVTDIHRITPIRNGSRKVEDIEVEVSQGKLGKTSVHKVLGNYVNADTMCPACNVETF